MYAFNYDLIFLYLIFHLVFGILFSNVYSKNFYIVTKFILF